MNWITGIQNAIDYIEEHLMETIDYDIVAKQCFSSSYHFQRVFSILCGYTIGEYVRNRRLSLAGSELSSSDIKVIDVALKYGYESPDSFSRAFKKFHGVLPSQVRQNGIGLKSFSRLVLKISLEGGNEMKYRIEEKQAISLVGHKLYCKGSPTNTENTYNETRQHWLSSRDLQRKLKKKRIGGPIWYDIYTDFSDDNFSHIIATQVNESDMCEDLEVVYIPPHLYAVFETEHCESPDDEWILLMKRIVSEWLPTTDYVISEHPQINKLYFEKNYSKRYMEIWIPIKKRE